MINDNPQWGYLQQLLQALQQHFQAYNQFYGQDINYDPSQFSDAGFNRGDGTATRQPPPIHGDPRPGGVPTGWPGGGATGGTPTGWPPGPVHAGPNPHGQWGGPQAINKGGAAGIDKTGGGPHEFQQPPFHHIIHHMPQPMPHPGPNPNWGPPHHNRPPPPPRPGGRIPQPPRPR